MDLAKEHIEYISNALRSHAVTYHTVARDLGIHVSKSKAMLLSYYRANKARVSASFVGTGKRQGNVVVRIFESEADLVEACPLVFDAASAIHVYCLQPNGNPFSPVDIALEERKHRVDFAKVAHYHKLGLIEIPEPKGVSPGMWKGLTGAPTGFRIASSLKAAVLKQQQGETRDNSLDDTESEPFKPQLIYQSRKQQPKTSSTSNYVGEKSTNTVRTAAPLTHGGSSLEEPQYEYKSRKMEKSQPRERVIVSNMDLESALNDETTQDPPVVKPRVTETELNALFLDGFTDDDHKDAADQEIEVDQPTVVENGEKDAMSEDPANGRAPEVETTLAVQRPGDDIWKSISAKSRTSETVSESRGAPDPAPATTVDDDGYFTLYKQSEPKFEPASKPDRSESARVMKPAKKSSGKTKQSSVMSFFQKM